MIYDDLYFKEKAYPIFAAFFRFYLSALRGYFLLQVPFKLCRQHGKPIDRAKTNLFRGNGRQNHRHQLRCNLGQAIDEDPDTNQFYIYNTISAIDLEAELVKEDGSWKVLSHIQYDASDSPAKASSDLKECDVYDSFAAALTAGKENMPAKIVLE